MNSVTIQATSSQIQEMKAYYENHLIKEVPYSVFRAKVNQITITAYQSGKVLFQGANADLEANRWGQIKPSSQVNPPAHQDYQTKTLIGSDEVGNGSYFGALTVCSVYLGPQQFELAQTLGVKDSKLLSDHQIKDIAWQLKESFDYHLTICDPIKYNQNIDRLNAVGIKVSLHNFTIQKLIAKLSDEQRSHLDGVMIDEFTSKQNYLKYLRQEKYPYQQNLIFEKKAESLHLSVACASIIARDAFLTSLERLGQDYHLTLPSGAGTNVDKIGKQLVQKYGPDILKQLAKVHFKNTKKILN